MRNTDKVVYLVNDKAPLIGEMLTARGFEVLVGDGILRDDYLSRCWALVPGRSYVTKDILDKAPELKLICKQGVGLDRIDLQSCHERGIHVANTPGSNALAVAEHTMALMLACTKQLYPISRCIRREVPDHSCTVRYKASELASKTLAVIGYGNIGSRVAAMARAFDMNVIVYTRHPERYYGENGIEFSDSLDETLAAADVVSLHVAGTVENRHLIGRQELMLMKPTAVIINTTRGFVVDEKALYEALVNKTIAGAGLDVFEHEPLTGDNPLLTLDNVFATPHSAANTPEANRRAHLQCVRIISEFAEELEQ